MQTANSVPNYITLRSCSSTLFIQWKPRRSRSG